MIKDKKINFTSSKNHFPTTYQEFIYKRTYSRWLDSENRREEWGETVKRFYDFFLDKIPKNKIGDFQEVCKSILSLDVMPSMRCLWTAGKALKRENLAAYNCAYSEISTVKSFAELLYILMNGAGCFHPNTKILTKTVSKEISHITIDDEILTYDEKEEKFKIVNPLLVHENNTENNEKIEIELENGYIFRCTSDHKILTKNRGYVQAIDLTEEDDIINYHEID